MIELTPVYGADDYTARASFPLDVTGVADMIEWKRSFSPAKLHLEYEYSSEFGQWKLNTWEVSGPIRLKSGALSTKLNGQRRGWGRSVSDGIPAWISAAITEYRPIGSLIFTHGSRRFFGSGAPDEVIDTEGA